MMSRRILAAFVFILYCEAMMTERWIESEHGPRLFTRAWDAGAGTPSVGIVHGLGDHSGRWLRVGDSLQRRGFSAYALDLPGHGRSEGKRGHVNSWEDYRHALRVVRRDHGFFSEAPGNRVELQSLVHERHLDSPAVRAETPLGVSTC